jgi:N-acetylmuramoyl-L-alanine amidase
MPRDYLSASTQEHNLYVGGSNEEVEMNDVMVLVAPILLAAGHEVRMGGRASAADNVRDSNKWGADSHTAIHSNAGGGVGLEVWYYPGSVKGRMLANALYARLQPLMPWPGRGVKSSAKYIETHGPNAPAVIIEFAFHDSAEQAEFLRTHHAELAAATAQGIIDVFGGTVVSPPPPVKPPTPTTPPATKIPTVLKEGSRGNGVRTIQHILAIEPCDSIFGSGTRGHVVQFQRDLRVAPTGVILPAFFEFLKKMPPTVGLWSGHKAWVRVIQRAVGVKDDGIFGLRTRRAVKVFQKAHGLDVDGIVGEHTWLSIREGD